MKLPSTRGSCVSPGFELLQIKYLIKNEYTCIVMYFMK